MKAVHGMALALSLLSPALQARDQVPHEKKAALSPLEFNAADQTIMSSSRQYAPSIKGLREYLSLEVAADAREFGRLNTRLEELERQDQLAFRAAMVPAGLGIGSLLVGSLLRQDEEPSDPRMKSIHERGGRLMLYGLGGIALGFLVNVALSPGEEDVRNFIQVHNGEAVGSSRAKPAGSGLSLGLMSGDSVVSLSYRF